jgi:predicted HD phosphohydrolase
MADGDRSDSSVANPRASFRTMEASTREDWQIISQAAAHFGQALPDRILSHLRALQGDCGGFVVDRLEHSLQTATRAMHDGRDEEYVVCALLHDMGDLLGPNNHADIAAAVLKPFVSEQNHWMVEKHAIFQGYYFFHHLGLDRNLREQFRGQPWFDYTEEFCAKYDGPAFDPDYRSAPLSEFEPLVRKVLATVKRSIYMPVA